MKSIKANVLLNTVKQFCSLAFPLITITYANRVLGVENIGMFSFSQTTVSYFAIFAALGVSAYGMRNGARIRGDKKKVEAFISQVYSINILMTILALIGVSVLLMIPFFERYRSLIFVLSIGIVLTTIGTDWVNTIYEDYLYLTIRYIVLQILGIGALFLFVKTESDLLKYVIINLCVSSGGNLLNIVYIRKKVKFHFTFNMNLKVHMVPLLILFVNQIASSIYLSSDVTMLGILTDDNVVGIYSNASKCYSLIKGIINAAITVMVPRFSYYIANDSKNTYKKSLNMVVQYVNVILVPAVIGLLFEAEGILYVLGGSDFVAGASTLRILAIAIIPATYACILSYCVLMPMGDELIFMISTICAAVSNIVLNLLFIPLWGMDGAAFTTFLAEIIVVGIALYKSRQNVKITIEINDSIRCLIGGMGIVAVCIVSSFVTSNVVVRLIIAAVISAPIYFIILLLLRHEVVVSMANKILKRRDFKQRKKT